MSKEFGLPADEADTQSDQARQYDPMMVGGAVAAALVIAPSVSANAAEAAHYIAGHQPAPKVGRVLAPSAIETGLAEGEAIFAQPRLVSDGQLLGNNSASSVGLGNLEAASSSRRLPRLTPKSAMAIAVRSLGIYGRDSMWPKRTFMTYDRLSFAGRCSSKDPYTPFYKAIIDDGQNTQTIYCTGNHRTDADPPDSNLQVQLNRAGPQYAELAHVQPGKYGDTTSFKINRKRGVVKYARETGPGAITKSLAKLIIRRHKAPRKVWYK